jgi:hypothetical protein
MCLIHFFRFLVQWRVLKYFLSTPRITGCHLLRHLHFLSILLMHLLITHAAVTYLPLLTAGYQKIIDSEPPRIWETTTKRTFNGGRASGRRKIFFLYRKSIVIYPIFPYCPCLSFSVPGRSFCYSMASRKATLILHTLLHKFKARNHLLDLISLRSIITDTFSSSCHET